MKSSNENYVSIRMHLFENLQTKSWVSLSSDPDSFVEELKNVLIYNAA